MNGIVAQLALQQTNEPLAREALTKRKSYQETAAMTAQLEQKHRGGQAQKDIQTLESKIAEAKTKKDMYIARARSATSQKT